MLNISEIIIQIRCELKICAKHEEYKLDEHEMCAKYIELN